jgi:hypothetical protein
VRMVLAESRFLNDERARVERPGLAVQIPGPRSGRRDR